MITKNRLVYGWSALLALPALESFAGTADFSVELLNTFDYPGSPLSTQPQKISDRGAVVGVFIDFSGVSSGFVRFPSGRFSAPLVDPQDGANVTQARGINSFLEIWGNYTDSGGQSHGFFARGNDVPQL